MARQKPSIVRELVVAILFAGALIYFIYLGRHTSIPLAGLAAGVSFGAIGGVFAKRLSGFLVDPKKQLRSNWRSTFVQMDVSGLAQEHSGEVCRRLVKEEPFRGCQRVLAFAPARGEVDLTEALHAYLEAGKTVCLPRINWAKKTMTPCAIDSLEGLVTHRHGILEPSEDAPVVPVVELDLILVPGVAFDAKCNRVGRGGGFYDRFLAGMPTVVKTYGVAFDAQIVKSAPVLGHDQALDAVLTESRLFVRS